MVPVAIALGSNLGDRLAWLERAVSLLTPHLAGILVSSFIETEPVGADGQPPFLNGAVVGRWAGTPRALLDELLGLERRCGRERPFPGAARTLDLDLILCGDAVLQERDLVVPHPRFRDRAFVLEPLAEIAQDMRDPVTGKTVTQLLHMLRARAGCASP